MLKEENELQLEAQMLLQECRIGVIGEQGGSEREDRKQEDDESEGSSPPEFRHVPNPLWPQKTSSNAIPPTGRGQPTLG